MSEQKDNLIAFPPDKWVEIYPRRAEPGQLLPFAASSRQNVSAAPAVEENSRPAFYLRTEPSPTPGR